MRIKSVTVGLGITESLPGTYGNVKPSLTLTAELDPGEDANRVIQTLDAQVTGYCYAKIDNALEMEGESPKFYTGTLFRLAFWSQRGDLYILPAGTRLKDLPGKWSWQCQGMRLQTVRARAAATQDKDMDVLDHSDGNFDEIHDWWAALDWYVVYHLIVWRDRWDWYPKQFILVPYDLVEEGDEPDGLETFDMTPRLLEDHTRKIEKDWIVVRDRQKLDDLVREWVAEHPRPSDSQFQ